MGDFGSKSALVGCWNTNSIGQHRDSRAKMGGIPIHYCVVFHIFISIMFVSFFFDVSVENMTCVVCSDVRAVGDSVHEVSESIGRMTKIMDDIDCILNGGDQSTPTDTNEKTSHDTFVEQDVVPLRHLDGMSRLYWVFVMVVGVAAAVYAVVYERTCTPVDVVRLYPITLSGQ